MRVITLNVNGVRSAANKGLFRWLATQRPDVVCLQEMKCQEADLDAKLHGLKLYQSCHAFAKKKGYSGVALYSRKNPDEVKVGFEILKASPYAFDLHRLAALWNHGSVIRSWLLELAEAAFDEDADLSRIRGFVEDTGEGRWTLDEAIEHAVPAPALAMSVFMRFRSRQDDSFAAKVLAALRNEFGGHAVKTE